MISPSSVTPLTPPQACSFTDTEAQFQEISKQSTLFDEKLLEIFPKILINSQNPLFQIVIQKTTSQFLVELEKGCAELKSRAVKELKGGKDSFIVKIQPEKESSLMNRGIHLTAIFIVQKGELDPSNIIVKGNIISGIGSKRQVHPAIQLNNDFLVQQKLTSASTKTFDTSTQVELAILEKLGKHPNVVELVLKIDKEKTSDEPNPRPAIYYEWLPSSFTGNGPDNSPKTVQKILGQLKDVVEGLKHCHSLDIYHGDLNPRNIRLNDKGVAKLIDFGNSVRLSGDDRLYLTCTYCYCSPHLLKKYNEREFEDADGDTMNIEELRRYYQSLDLWSFACVAFELLNSTMKTGHERLPIAILKRIEECNYLDRGVTDFDKRTVIEEINFLDSRHPEYLQELNLFAESHGVFGALIKKIFITEFEEIKQLPTWEEISQALNEYSPKPMV